MVSIGKSTVRLVRALEGLHDQAPDAALYRLEPEFHGQSHVIATGGISAALEVLMFAADADGNVVSWAVLHTVAGTDDHGEAFAAIGYAPA